MASFLGYTVVSGTKFQVSSPGHSLKLYKKSSRLELRKHFFSQRIVDHWNKLPDNVVSAATISSFKRRLDIWLERYGH